MLSQVPDLVRNVVTQYNLPQKFEAAAGLVKTYKWTSLAIGISGCFLYRATKLFVLSKFYKSPPIIWFELPFIGSVVSMVVWAKHFRLKLLPKYGDLVRMHMFGIKFYKINEAELCSKIFQKAYQRPPLFADAKRAAGVEPDLVGVNNDDHYDYRRKFYMQSIASVLNKSAVEEKICSILQQVTYNFLDAKLAASANGQYVWYPKQGSRNCTFNVIYGALFNINKVYGLDSALFQDYAKYSDIMLKTIPVAALASRVSPFWRNVLFASGLKKYQHAEAELGRLITTSYEESEVSVESEAATIAECYAKDFKLGKEVMMADLLAVVHGGIGTTSHSIELGLLLLAKYPKMQERVWKELQQVFGEADKFTLSKINTCPLTRAFVHEAVRIAAPGPDGIFRTCDRDLRCVKMVGSDGVNTVMCEFTDSDVWRSDEMKNKISQGGILYDYIIEKYSVIEPNIGYMLRDPKIWNLGPDPLAVNLEYWLKTKMVDGEEKLVFVNNKQAISFSVPKRDCPGQALAIKELLGFFGNLLLKYKISAVEKDLDKITFDFTWGAVVFSMKDEVPVVIERR